MVMLNVFENDAFSSIQLTLAVEKVPFMPVGIGNLGVFEDMPVRTKAMAVEQRQGRLYLIPVSDRGEEGIQRQTEKRQIRHFNIPRLMTSDTLKADELQGIRAFGQETELMQVEAEVSRRLAGPTGLTRNMEFTWEYHRLAAVQGKLLDADGTLLYDWFAEFQITAPPVIQFDLAAGTVGSLRPIINNLVRSMARKSQGAFLPTTQVWGLCGDAFYDAFVNHPDVVKTFLNWSAAADLRDNRQGAAFDVFNFAGVNWFNYRGSDDQSTISIPTDEVSFFPVGAPGVFQRGLAPGETFEWVNTPGKPQYIIPIFDRDRNSWWKMELYSYPLHICTRPEVLFKGQA